MESLFEYKVKHFWPTGNGHLSPFPADSPPFFVSLKVELEVE
jgi:hypothetical protein